MLTGEQFMQVRKLAESMLNILRWFDNDRRLAYPALVKVIGETYYEKVIMELIDDVLLENGEVKDTASEDLARIRSTLYRAPHRTAPHVRQDRSETEQKQGTPQISMKPS